MARDDADDEDGEEDPVPSDLASDEPGTVSHPVLDYRYTAINCALILTWYTFSLTISLFNKWFFGVRYLNFQFPLFATSIQMMGQFLFALLALALVPKLQPPSDALLGAKQYLVKIGPCGTATGLDIGLSNASLKSISLAFYSNEMRALEFLLMTQPCVNHQVSLLFFYLLSYSGLKSFQFG